MSQLTYAEFRPVNRRHLLICAILLAPFSSLAQQADEATNEATDTDRRILPLRDLLSPVDSLKLTGLEDEVEFNLHVPIGNTVDKAILHLGYVNSDRLIPDQSALELTINETLVARLPVTGNARTVRGTIEIPPAWFRTGLNRLAIQAQQRHRAGCDASFEGEMWTQIEHSASHLRLSMQRQDVWEGLAMLDQPGWSWLPAGRSVEIITASPSLNESTVEIGALAAQAFALRGGGWPIAFSHRNLAATSPLNVESVDAESLRLPESDDPTFQAPEPVQALAPTGFGSQILIGLQQELLPLLGAEWVDEINGPFLAFLARKPASSGGFLIISGRNENDLRQAVLRFAQLDIPLPSVTHSVFQPKDQLTRFDTPFLESDRLYDFSELGFSMTNDSRQQGTIFFQLPEDYFVADNRRAEIRLNFAYRRDLPSNTRLNVLVNGEPADVIKLESRDGAIVRNGRVVLPLRSFRPGGNEISFRPTLGSGEIVNCEKVDDPGDWIEIFDDSTLIVPEGASVPGQRELNIVQSLGYPFGDASRLSPWLVLPEPNSSSLSAAWTVLGRLSQTLGAPIVGLRATTSMPGAGAGDAILVAARPQVPNHLLRQSGLSGGILRHRPSEADPQDEEPIELIARAGEAPTITNVAYQDERASPSWLGELQTRPASLAQSDSPVSALSDQLTHLSNQVRRAFSKIAYSTGIPLRESELFGVHDGAIAVVNDGSDQDYQVLVVTAASTNELQMATSALIRPQIWENLTGTAAGWTNDPPRVIAVRRGDPIAIDKLPDQPGAIRLQLNNLLAANPEWWLALVFFVISACALFARMAFDARQDPQD